MTAESGGARARALQIAVLCGGGGTRLSPISTEEEPKPFQKLFGQRTLLDATLERVSLCGPDRVLLVGNRTHKQTLLEATRDFQYPALVLLEPAARNTAAGVLLAAHAAEALKPGGILIVLPSDHWVEDAEVLDGALQTLTRRVEDDGIGLVGATAHSADPGYGYFLPDNGTGRITRFIEKPPSPVAVDLIERGALWNMGVFVFRTDRLLRHAAATVPELSGAVERAWRDRTEDNKSITAGTAFTDAPSEPFDRAIVENHPKRFFERYEKGWSDLGTWDSLLELFRDQAGNAAYGPVTLEETSGSVVYSEGPAIHVSGVEGIAVAARDGVVRVSSLKERRGLEEAAQPSLEPSGTLDLDWLREQAVPRWFRKGWDPQSGLFAEAFEGGSADFNRPPRLRNQARQSLALAAAIARAELTGFAETLDRAFLTLEDWPLEEEPTYDLAQALAAAAECFCLLPERSETLCERIADILLRRLDRTGSTPLFGSSDGTLCDANSHMHIVSAAQNWERVSPDNSTTTLLRIGWDAFDRRFLDIDNWRVRESSNSPQNWSPGHHFEWARLLRQRGDDASSNLDIPLDVKLYMSARMFGGMGNGLSALTVDGHDRPSTVSRAWVQAEHLRAVIALGFGDDVIERALDRLSKSHTTDEAPGLWRDYVGAGTDQGRITAGTFHHIALALIERDEARRTLV